MNQCTETPVTKVSCLFCNTCERWVLCKCYKDSSVCFGCFYFSVITPSMPVTVFTKTNNTLGKKDSYRATGRGRCRSQQGPQCVAIDKGGRAGTCWPQALGRNEIVPSLPGGGSIALVKINFRKSLLR